MWTGQRPWSGLGQMQVIFHLTQRKKRLQFPPDTPPQLQVGACNFSGLFRYLHPTKYSIIYAIIVDDDCLHGHSIWVVEEPVLV